MAATEEIFDVVDEQDRVIGQAPRTEVHARGLKHRAVHVFVFNLHGDLFVQKRAVGKDTFPGRYDSSASGHLEGGEEYDACALRELHEELGLSISPVELHKRFKISACQQTGWEFVWVYDVRGDYHPVVNPAEIDSGGFWPVSRALSLINERPAECAPSFTLVVCEYRRRGLLPDPA